MPKTYSMDMQVHPSAGADGKIVEMYIRATAVCD
jgi:hypothetical protein